MMKNSSEIQFWLSRSIAKKVMIPGLMLFFVSKSFACDICGCGAGNINLGILPHWDKNTIGTRYRTLSFESHLSSDIYSERLKTKERFVLVDVWTRINLYKRWQALAFLPYFMAKQVATERTNYRKGIADALVLLQYQWVNTEVTHPEKDWQHQGFVGGGAKLPTGEWKYSSTNESEVANPNFQPGTGSFDFLVNTQYTLKRKNAGLMLDCQYRINGSNANQYQFGNRISGNVNAFYLSNRPKKRSVMLFAGAWGELSQLNSEFGFPIKQTGGHLMMAQTGIELFINKLSLGAWFQLPINQHLGGGSFKSNNRLVLQLGFSM